MRSAPNPTDRPRRRWLQRLRRAGKLALLGALKASGGFNLARRVYRHHVRILCYHGMWCHADGFRGDAMFISPDTFDRRLAILARRNFKVVSLDDAIATLDRTRPLEDAVVITIDDGWTSVFAHALPSLRRHGMPATIYVDTENLLAGGPVPHVMATYLRRLYRAPAGRMEAAEAAFSRVLDREIERPARLIALRELAELLEADFDGYANYVFSYMTPQQLAAAQCDGFAVELHTHSHSMHGFEPQRIEAEIGKNREVLAELTGCAPHEFRHFCYPSGVSSPHARPVLQRLGIVSATTLEPRLASQHDDPLLLPRILDGEHLSELEFEAELCGVGEALRAMASALQRGWSLLRLRVAPVYQSATAR